jgi:hypothetical protein
MAMEKTTGLVPATTPDGTAESAAIADDAAVFQAAETKALAVLDKVPIETDEEGEGEGEGGEKEAVEGKAKEEVAKGKEDGGEEENKKDRLTSATWLARKEAELRRKTKEADERIATREKDAEARLVERERNIEEVAHKAEKIVTGIKLAMTSPGDFYKQVFGLEKEQLANVAKDLWFEAMGKEPPEDVKQSRGMAQIQQQMQLLAEQNKRLQEQMEEKHHREQSMGRQMAYKGTIDTLVANLPERFEHLAAHAEADKEELVLHMLEAANSIMEREGVGEYEFPDATKVAEELEEALRSRWETVYGKKYQKANGQERVGKKKPRVSPALSERQLTSSTTTQGPPKDDDERLARALAKAEEMMRERER